MSKGQRSPTSNTFLNYKAHALGEEGSPLSVDIGSPTLGTGPLGGPGLPRTVLTRQKVTPSRGSSGWTLKKIHKVSQLLPVIMTERNCGGNPREGSPKALQDGVGLGCIIKPQNLSIKIRLIKKKSGENKKQFLSSVCTHLSASCHETSSKDTVPPCSSPVSRQSSAGGSFHRSG